MSGRISLLGTLLAVQLVVIAGVLFMESGAGEGEQGPYLSFAAADVDEIRITSAEDESGVTISRTENGWRLPDGLPADGGKVDELLERLGQLSAPWPVATSGNARERFEVTRDQHQRHLVLSAGGKPVVDLYLGTSPGYQRVHARRADDDAVFSVGLSNFQVPVGAGEWLDKTLLKSHGEIQSVARLGAWRLQRRDEGWVLNDDNESGAGAGEAAGKEAADRLVRRFAELRVVGIAAAPAEDAAPAARFQVTDADGEYTLALWKHGDAEPYTVHSSRRDEHFELASYVADQLLQERNALLPAQDDAADDASAETPPEAEAPPEGAAEDMEDGAGQ